MKRDRKEIINHPCNCHWHKAKKDLEKTIKDDGLLEKMLKILFDLWYEMCEESEGEIIKSHLKIEELERKLKDI